MNLDELKPGPETDRLVAELLDLTGAQSDGGPSIGLPLHVFIEGERRAFAPSTDLNDAFWAVDQVLRMYSLTRESGGMFSFCSAAANFSGPIRAATPAMAICKAIIAHYDSNE